MEYEWDVPSGNLLHNYWKWPFIVNFPMKNGDFPYVVMLAYQRVTDWTNKEIGLNHQMFCFYGKD